MTEWFKEHTIREFGRYRLVEPTVVVEIAFDVIHRSTRHDSGFAMRFPRIVRIRPTSARPRWTCCRPSRSCTSGSSSAAATRVATSTD
jgi:DNA ligase-1